MTTLKCGCRIVSDVIDLNKTDRICWMHNLKTFVNICGRCHKKEMKFQYMENKLIEMEKQRMLMFLKETDEEEEAFFDFMELKEHLKTLPANERHKVKDFERPRNLANGLDPNEGMDEIDMIINQLEEEERDEQPEPEEDSDNDSVDSQIQRNRQMFTNMLRQVEPETNAEH